ncbi:hypothetical protein HK405_003207 [Cladochytrium tenue]|nr:hypothetical protein HK405_003207 [Cladochytrium tenue]
MQQLIREQLAVAPLLDDEDGDPYEEDFATRDDDDIPDSDFESTDEDEYLDDAAYEEIVRRGGIHSDVVEDDDERYRRQKKRRLHSQPERRQQPRDTETEPAATPGTSTPAVPSNKNKKKAYRRKDYWMSLEVGAPGERRTSHRPQTVRSKQRLEQKLRERQADAASHTPNPAPPPHPQRQLTQQELIAEALEVTEPMNLKFLDDVSRLEDEWHRNARAAAAAARSRSLPGPTCTFFSTTLDHKARRVSQLPSSPSVSGGSDLTDDDDDDDGDGASASDASARDRDARAALAAAVFRDPNNPDAGLLLPRSESPSIEPIPTGSPGAVPPDTSAQNPKRKRKELVSRNYIVFKGYRRDPLRWMKAIDPIVAARAASNQLQEPASDSQPAPTTRLPTDAPDDRSTPPSPTSVPVHPPLPREPTPAPSAQSGSPSHHPADSVPTPTQGTHSKPAPPASTPAAPASPTHPSSAATSSAAARPQRPPPPLPPPPPRGQTCPITGLPARYRDPRTATPYASKEAFAILRLCHDHHYAWSPLLDAFVHAFDAPPVRKAPPGWRENCLGRPPPPPPPQPQPHASPPPPPLHASPAARLVSRAASPAGTPSASLYPAAAGLRSLHSNSASGASTPAPPQALPPPPLQDAAAPTAVPVTGPQSAFFASGNSPANHPPAPSPRGGRANPAG